MPTEVSIIDVGIAGRLAASATSSAARTPPSGCTLRTTASAASSARDALRVGDRADALVGRNRHRDPAPDAREVLDGRHRLLGELDAVTGERAEAGDGRVEVPRAVGVDPQRDRRADGVAHRGDDVDVAGVADLHLHAAVARKRGPIEGCGVEPASLHERVDGYLVADRGREPDRGGLLGGTPRRTGVARVPGERRALTPAGRPLQQREPAAADTQPVLGQDRHNPTPSSTATTTSIFDVATSAATSDGGSARVSTRRAGAHRERRRRQARAAPTGA